MNKLHAANKLSACSLDTVVIPRHEAMGKCLTVLQVVEISVQRLTSLVSVF